MIGEVLFQTFCCLCTSSLAFSTNIIATFDQHVSLVVSINNQVTHIAIVYGSISYILKIRLGENLVMDHQNHPSVWAYVRDFNAIIGAFEKHGGHSSLRASSDELSSWCNLLGLSHIPSRGVEFTWSNGRHKAKTIDIRLGHTLCNHLCLDSWSSVSYVAHIHFKSDHFPLMLSLYNAKSPLSSSI